MVGPGGYGCCASVNWTQERDGVHVFHLKPCFRAALSCHYGLAPRAAGSRYYCWPFGQASERCAGPSRRGRGSLETLLPSVIPRAPKCDSQGSGTRS